jgi:hypothetical protein
MGARATYLSDTTLKVLVPAVPPGAYNVTVTTSKGTSNAVVFTVRTASGLYCGRCEKVNRPEEGRPQSKSPKSLKRVDAGSETRTRTALWAGGF